MPEIWRPWTRGLRELPEWLQLLDRRTREKTGRKTGGIPDVIAWNNVDCVASALLVECKGPNEDPREGQEDWVSAALELELTEDQFAVAVRQVSEP